MRFVPVLLVLTGVGNALIFRDGPAPEGNTETAPVGAWEGSGWGHQVYYLNYHGTVISPKHVITARHLGAGEEVITKPVFFGGREGETYAIKGDLFTIGETDFSIFEVWETFPSYAELYEGQDEEGREVVIHGSGVDRGEKIEGVGWRWGAGTRKSRWGRNLIKGSLNSGESDFLYFGFDDVFGKDEVMATGGDSGGGWFIKDEGEWKLAAISSSVDSLYSQSEDPKDSNGFRGAFYDAGGLFFGDDSRGWQKIPPSRSSNSPGNIAFYRQSHAYGSRVSSRLAEIEAIIAPALVWEGNDAEGRFKLWLDQHGVPEVAGPVDDSDGDGLSNLEEYFTESHPGDPREALPALESGVYPDERHKLVLRESLDLEGRFLGAMLESSDDLVSWNPINDLIEESEERDNPAGVRTREFSRAISGNRPLFYRVRIALGDH